MMSLSDLIFGCNVVPANLISNQRDMINFDRDDFAKNSRCLPSQYEKF